MNENDFSARDVQWLAGVLAVTTTMLNENATEVQLEQNYDALQVLLVTQYSVAELTALLRRIIASLPANTPLRFAYQIPLAPCASTLQC